MNLKISEGIESKHREETGYAVTINKLKQVNAKN